MSLTVTRLGSGEAFDPHLGNSAAVIAGDGVQLLVDCGFSVPPRLWQLFPDSNAIDAIYLTHAHADHLFGLIPVLTCWHDAGRTRPLRLICSSGVRRIVEQLMRLGMMPALDYPLSWRLNQSQQLAGLNIEFAPMQHSVECHAVRVSDGEVTVGFSGDGRLTSLSTQLLQSCDLALVECYGLQPLPPTSAHNDLTAVSQFAEASRGAVLIYHLNAQINRSEWRERLAALPSIALWEDQPEALVVTTHKAALGMASKGCV